MYEIPIILKKFFVIPVILILALSQSGYYFLMRDLQSGIKSEMKEYIDKDLSIKDLQRISYEDNIQKISWEDGEKNEFSLNGEMYDIVKCVHENGKTILYCIDDKKEKSLVDTYNSVTKQNSASGKQLKNIQGPITLFFENKAEVFFSSKGTIYFSLPIPNFPQGNLNDIFSPPRI